jgi:uracil-DNA glycosylase family 4
MILIAKTLRTQRKKDVDSKDAVEIKVVLEQVEREVAQCEKCPLHFSRKHAVPGEGPANAEVMFIGEGPGFHENEQGRPFVGAAGKYLDDLLAGVGMRRQNVFITNVVKCRPPGNRDPNLDELAACEAYLDRQIHALNPKVIITLGRFSMAKFIPNAKISQVHGQVRRIDQRFIMPMYHPAAALHQPSLQSFVERDFAQLPQLIAQAAQMSALNGPGNGTKAAGVENPPQKPKQLSLF